MIVIGHGLKLFRNPLLYITGIERNLSYRLPVMPAQSLTQKNILQKMLKE